MMPMRRRTRVKLRIPPAITVLVIVAAAACGDKSTLEQEIMSPVDGSSTIIRIVKAGEPQGPARNQRGLRSPAVR